jgi:uncharacterized protein (UPF0254 family)
MWRGAWSVQAMRWVLLYRSATDGEVSLHCEQHLYTHECLGVHIGLKCGVERGAWSVQAMQWVLLYRSATDGEVSLRCEQELHTHRCLGVHRGFKCGVERAGHAVGPPVPVHRS